MSRLRILVVGFLAALSAAGEARAQLAYPPDGGVPSSRTLRMTVAASDDGSDKPANSPPLEEGQRVNTLHEMFAAIRECWEPPPPAKSRPGMEYTVRFTFKSDGELIAPPHMTYATHDVPDDVRNVYREAVEATFKRCTPMHFTASMAAAIAGRPMGYRFFDNRIMIEHFKGGDNGDTSGK